MAGSKAIKIELRAQQESLQRRLDSGLYNDASDVMRAALRALDREETTLDDVHREEVRASIADRRPSVAAEDVFKRLEARHARKVKADRRGA